MLSFSVIYTSYLVVYTAKPLFGWETKNKKGIYPHLNLISTIYLHTHPYIYLILKILFCLNLVLEFLILKI
jgi:hypothetical protein